MDLEEKLEHAESTHTHTTPWRPEFGANWMDSWTHEDRTSLSSQSYMLFWSIWNWNLGTIHVEERIFIMDWYPGVQTATWMKLGKNKKSLHKTLRWWVPQALSNHTRWQQALRNQLRRSNRNTRAFRWIFLPRHFIHFDQRKWNDFLAVNNVKQESFAWKISKTVMVFSRHRKLYWEIDGAIYWSSLLPMLRRDVENEGAGTFSDSRWLDFIHTGGNKPRFQFCVDSNNNLLQIRAIQGYSGGDLIDPESLKACLLIPT